jgi:hypothetical protein
MHGKIDRNSKVAINTGTPNRSMLSPAIAGNRYLEIRYKSVERTLATTSSSFGAYRIVAE